MKTRLRYPLTSLDLLADGNATHLRADGGFKEIEVENHLVPAALDCIKEFTIYNPVFNINANPKFPDDVISHNMNMGTKYKSIYTDIKDRTIDVLFINDFRKSEPVLKTDYVYDKPHEEPDLILLSDYICLEVYSGSKTNYVKCGFEVSDPIVTQQIIDRHYNKSSTIELLDYITELVGTVTFTVYRGSLGTAYGTSKLKYLMSLSSKLANIPMLPGYIPDTAKEAIFDFPEVQIFDKKYILSLLFPYIPQDTKGTALIHKLYKLVDGDTSFSKCTNLSAKKKNISDRYTKIKAQYITEIEKALKPFPFKSKEVDFFGSNYGTDRKNIHNTTIIGKTPQDIIDEICSEFANFTYDIVNSITSSILNFPITFTGKGDISLQKYAETLLKTEFFLDYLGVRPKCVANYNIKGENVVKLQVCDMLLTKEDLTSIVTKLDDRMYSGSLWFVQKQINAAKIEAAIKEIDKILGQPRSSNPV